MFQYIFVSIILSLIFYILALYSASNSLEYYSYDMPLGPLSRSPSILVPYIIIVTLTIILIIILKVRKEKKRSLYFYIFSFLIPFFATYVLPQYFDYAYAENFYDASAHMSRGMYVTLMGHSDIHVDAYFDVQPAFFWWTATFINIIYGTPVSSQDPIFIFLMKWFNIVILMISLPILLVLFKVAGLSLRESFLACAVFLLISTRIHYSAQAYAYVLYWLVLVLILRFFRRTKLGLDDILIYMLVTFSIVFVHQGITLFTLVSVAALVPGVLIRSSKLRINVYINVYNSIFTLVVLLIISWLIYLSYLTKYTFGNFLVTLKNVVITIIEKGVPSIVIKSITRPYELWAQIVLAKAIYFALLMLIVIIILLIVNILNEKHEISYRIFLFIFSALTAVIGTIALTLGGAGYFERLPQALTPIISFTFLKSFEYFSRIRLVLRVTFIAIISVLLLLGSTLTYFAGWNFQSTPYSEIITRNFIVEHGPNIANIYSKLCIMPLYYPAFPYEFIPNCLYVETWHNNIQAIYYLVGDPEAVLKARIDIIRSFSLIFDVPTARVYLD